MSDDNSHFSFSDSLKLISQDCAGFRKNEDQDVDDLLIIMMQKNEKLKSLIGTSFTSNAFKEQPKEIDNFEHLTKTHFQIPEERNAQYSCFPETNEYYFHSRTPNDDGPCPIVDLSNAFPSFNIEESLPVNKSTVIDLSQEVKDNKLKVSQIESETENIYKEIFESVPKVDPK